MSEPADGVKAAEGSASGWSALEIGVVVAIAVVVLVGGIYMLTILGGSPSLGDSPSSRTAESVEAPGAQGDDKMSRSQFAAHARDVIDESVAALERIVDAQAAQDLALVRAEADRLYRAMVADDAWQRSNEERILGGCYDDAAAAYSTFVVYLNAYARSMSEWAEDPTVGGDTVTYWGESSSEALRTYEAAIAAAC
jgi:hypothetical protein